MDLQALYLSLQLASLTVLILIPLGVFMAHCFPAKNTFGSFAKEAFIALPLVLPPTVLGFYLLVGFGGNSWFGRWFEDLTGQSLVFSFLGILIASLIFNIPFAMMPIQRAFEAIPQDLKDASSTCGLTPWQRLFKIEVPLANKGILSAAVMTFTHTLGEFGVVLMMGGNIPGQTRTLSIAIYDSVQSLEMQNAGIMSLFLLVFSFVTLIFTQRLSLSTKHFQGNLRE
jgi:molybdate transport system permease protein